MHKRFDDPVVPDIHQRRKIAGSARIARPTTSTTTLPAAGRARKTRFHLDAARVDGTNRKRLETRVSDTCQNVPPVRATFRPELPLWAAPRSGNKRLISDGYAGRSERI